MSDTNKPERFEKLKPCPFCGGEASTFTDYNMVEGSKVYMTAYVRCPICGVSQRIGFVASGISFDEFVNVFDNVISLWNTREG